MNVRDIGLMRLAAQRLTTGSFDKPDEVARHLLAMQAQDYNGGLWSVGLRTKQGTQRDVEKAIADRKLIRTWPMRGTLHFVHADDVHCLLQLTAPRATAAARSRRINLLGLTDEIVDEAERVLRHELRGGKAIARDKVVELLKSNVQGITIDNQHTQHLMRNFGERGVLCFGPHEGKQPTFVLLDEWVPKPADKPRDEALAELARRYFISHGPASLKDFAGWAMLTMTDAKAGLRAAEADLATADCNGISYYFMPGLKPLPQKQPLLLPGFDEYLLGYKDRSAVLAPTHADKIVPGGNGMFLPTVVQNGHVTGLWKRKLSSGKTKKVTFDYQPFKATTSIDTAISERRYSSFVA